jgi:hypothetical protein
MEACCVDVAGNCPFFLFLTSKPKLLTAATIALLVMLLAPGGTWRFSARPAARSHFRWTTGTWLSGSFCRALCTSGVTNVMGIVIGLAVPWWLHILLVPWDGER